jgi:hypothetical protein
VWGGEPLPSLWPAACTGRGGRPWEIRWNLDRAIHAFAESMGGGGGGGERGEGIKGEGGMEGSKRGERKGQGLHATRGKPAMGEKGGVRVCGSGVRYRPPCTVCGVCCPPPPSLSLTLLPGLAPACIAPCPDFNATVSAATTAFRIKSTLANRFLPDNPPSAPPFAFGTPMSGGGISWWLGGGLCGGVVRGARCMV